MSTSVLHADAFSESATASSEASAHWNTDTGATSHMTPHRHWFTSYTPLRKPIRLADNKIIYSAGVGSVRFQPVVNGKSARLLEFERVLHVPDLKNNLLSVLYLSVHKGYSVLIEKDHLSFRRAGALLFTATVNSNCAAFVDGHTVPPGQMANSAHTSTCPLDLALWHRRFAHLNVEDVRKVVREDLVTGLKLTSKAAPDPICEPCLAGKQHRGPIPKVATHRRSDLLGLVHSDVHGPLPVEGRGGYRYWILFIDDASRFWVVIPLRKKSDAFAAWKQFVAYAETQLTVKVKGERNDKGGEYMSKEWIQFSRERGIQRQHTVTNEAHQNGVGERSNRTMAEGVTAMLEEAKLPPSFWPYALAAFVHTHNRSPTSALTKATPYSM